MATRNPQIDQTFSRDGSVVRYYWSGSNKLGNGDVGAAIKMTEWADRSVQVFGTFGAGGTIVWEGSNDGGTTWFTLTDPQGNAISKTGAGGEAVTEITQLARPNVTAGDGTTSLEVHVLLRRANPLRT